MTGHARAHGIAKSALIILAAGLLTACGGAGETGSSAESKVESASRVKLDAKNSDTLLTSFNAMMAEQAEADRAKIATVVMMLTDGHDPKTVTDNRFYTYASAGERVRGMVGTSMGDLELRETFANASQRFPEKLDGLRDAQLIELYNEIEAKASAARTVAVEGAVTEMAEKRDEIQARIDVLSDRVAERYDAMMDLDPKYLENVTILSGETNGKMGQVQILAELVNGAEEAIGPNPRLKFHFIPKSYPELFIEKISGSIPVTEDGTRDTSIKSVPPGGRIVIRSSATTNDLFQSGRLIEKEKGRSASWDDYDLKVYLHDGRMGTGRRQNRPFSVKIDRDLRSQFQKERDRIGSCYSVLNTTETYLDIAEKQRDRFLADPKALGRGSQAVKVHDFNSDSLYQKCVAED